jgi:hypothetical protein
MRFPNTKKPTTQIPVAGRCGLCCPVALSAECEMEARSAYFMSLIKICSGSLCQAAKTEMADRLLPAADQLEF